MKELGFSIVLLLNPVSIPYLRGYLVGILDPKPATMLLGLFALLCNSSNLIAERTITLLPNHFILCPHFSQPDCRGPSFNIFKEKCLCIYTRVSCYEFPYKTELCLGFEHHVLCIL